ncbi:MBL fold metallo-hydrolase [Clostridium sp. DL1XJH146]
MKIKIIGNWGAFPEKGEASTGYLLEIDGYNILIDCGSGVLSCLQEYISLDDIDIVILSHYHWDHIADIFPFQYNCKISTALGRRKNPLEIYAHTKDNRFNQLNYGGACIAKEINKDTKLTFGKVKVTFEEVKHPAYGFAMRFEENGKIFAFSGDTEWCDGLINISKEADLFLCECSLFDDQLGKFKGHLTPGEIGKISNMNSIKKVVLTHFPHYAEIKLLKTEVEAIFRGEVELAKKGKEFFL